MDAGRTELTRRREAVVREHMASENELRFDDTLATFTHPRYELVGTGQVYDGVDEVKAYYAASRAVFPDQRNEIRDLHHADGAVVVEFDLLGTHTGSLAGEEPTGRSFRCPMVALFVFEGEGIVCERVYFDSGTIYRQLGLG
ncbi:MAG TPA: ester cyclase [Acidimicrobiales bacterium]|nr:ester cyclase [Acidimicrobiales bacterium]